MHHSDGMLHPESAWLSENLEETPRCARCK